MERRSDRLTAQYVDAVLSVLHDDEDSDGIVTVLLEYGLPIQAVVRIAAAGTIRCRFCAHGYSTSRRDREPTHQPGHT